MLHPAIALAFRLLIACVILVRSGCDCRPKSETWRGRFPPDPLAGLATGELPLRDGEQLGSTQRQQVAELSALVSQYYPVWEPERETEGDYYERYATTPEIERQHALVRQQVENPTWRACLREIRRSLPPQLWVRDGNPPGFYIPSFQVVIEAEHPRGWLTMVFRISMLAPFYDYYERFRHPVTGDVETSFAPTRDTARLAAFVRDIIAKHYPEYRDLAPEIGATRVPNLVAENTMLGKASLADLLFEDHRRW